MLCFEYQWVASFEVFALYEGHNDVAKLPASLVMLVLSFIIIVGMLVLLKIRPVPFGAYKTAFRNTAFCQNYYWYLIASRFVLMSIMVFGSQFKYIGFACMLVPFVNFFILNSKKPYESKGDLGRAMGNEAITFLILGIYSYYAAFVHRTDHDQTLNITLPYIVILALCACIALNITFLIKTILMFL